MKKYLRLVILILIIVLSIGYAAISTPLIFKGSISLGHDEDNFDIRFTKSVIDGINVSDTTISEDGKTVTYEVNNLTDTSQVSTLSYVITNYSSQYDANIEIICTSVGNNGNYFSIEKITPNVIAAKSNGIGSITASLSNSISATETFKCKIEATPIGRTSIAVEICDSASQTAPVITGAPNNWTYEDVTIEIGDVGTAISGVSMYEYYITESTEIPTSETKPTGTTYNEVIISDENIRYVYYRTVANSGCRSEWSTAQKVMIDKTVPILTLNNIPSSVTRGDTYAVVTDYNIGTLGGGYVSCISNYDGGIPTNNIGDLTTLGNHTISCTAATYAGLSINKSINVTITYAAYNATNIVLNGSFENGFNNWSHSDVDIIQDNCIHGNYCLRFNHNNGADFTAMTMQEVSAPILNHQYYGSIYFKTDANFGYGNIAPDNRFEIYNYNSEYIDLAMIFTRKSEKNTSWHRLSSIQSFNNEYYLTSAVDTWKIRNFERGTTDYSYSDALVIIDLTATFGSGNEPDFEWCNKHISYFDGTTTIYK